MIASSSDVLQHRTNAPTQLSSSLYVAYEQGLQQRFPDIASGTYEQWVDRDLVRSGRNAIASHYRQARYGELLFDISNSANIVVVYNMSDGQRFTRHVSFKPEMIGLHDLGTSYVSLYVIGFVDPCHDTWELIMQSFSEGPCNEKGARWCNYGSEWKVDTGVSCQNLAPSGTFARLDTDPIVLMDTQPHTSYLAFVYARPNSEVQYINGLPVGHSDAVFFWNQTSLETTVQVKSKGRYLLFKVGKYGSLSPVPSSKNLDCLILDPWLFNCTDYTIFINATGSFVPLVHAVGKPWPFTPPGTGSSVAYIREKLVDDGYEVVVCRPDIHGDCQVLPLSENLCDVHSQDAIIVVGDGPELVVTVCGSDRKAFFVPFIFTSGKYVAIKTLKRLRKIGSSVVQMLSFGKPFVVMVPPGENHPTISPDHLQVVLMSTLIPIVVTGAVCILCASIIFIACIYKKRTPRRSYHQVSKGDDVNQQLLLEMDKTQKEEEQEVKLDTERRGEHREEVQNVDGVAEDPGCEDGRLDISDFGKGVIMADTQPGEPRVVVAEVYDCPLSSSEDRQRKQLDNASTVYAQPFQPGDDDSTDYSNNQDDHKCKSVCKGCEMHCGQAAKGSECMCSKADKKQYISEQASNGILKTGDIDEGECQDDGNLCMPSVGSLNHVPAEGVNPKQCMMF